MTFPDTPVTLIGRLKQHHMPRLWETSWEEFFDIYQGAIRVCVCGSFRRYGWHHAAEQDIQHIVMQVFESLFRGNFSPDESKGHFRQLLTTIIQRRVIDFIRTRHKSQSEESLDNSSPEVATQLQSLAENAFEEQENKAFQTALIGTLLAALRTKVSPQTYMIFEMVKLIGESPENVASQMNISRAVVDNHIYKARKKLKEIIEQPEIRKEFDS